MPDNLTAVFNNDYWLLAYQASQFLHRQDNTVGMLADNGPSAVSDGFGNEPWRRITLAGLRIDIDAPPTGKCDGGGHHLTGISWKYDLIARPEARGT
jgi:hypothetical protein